MEPKLEQFIPQQELAEMFGVSPAYLNRLRKEEGLPYIRFGGKIFYHEPAVCEWLLSRQENQGSD